MIRVHQRRSSCRGFTLVELLVVIAIIGILVALLLPAVQSAREAARRSQCSNNMKQLMLGLSMFEDTEKAYPSGAYWYDFNWKCGKDGYPPCEDRKGTFITRILPYIEFQDLYDHIDFDVIIPPAGTDTPVDFQLLPDGTPIGSVEIPTIRCPSSEHPGENATTLEFPPDPKFRTFKMSNYAASRGNTKQITNPACNCPTWNVFNGVVGTVPTGLAHHYPDTLGPSFYKIFGGPFSRVSWGIKASMVTDGLSSTIFLGEVRPECSHNIARGWHYSNSGQGVVSTIIPINFDSCRIVDTASGAEACNVWCNFSTECGFKSPHPGGAHFGMGDGSVQFLSETIDMFSYNRLGGKADGEIEATE
jgi:prepilin-type N-terminal cleavage/methylation domain-containing protein/prepilin-type processing-associated H-X9-DG protein